MESLSELISKKSKEIIMLKEKLKSKITTEEKNNVLFQLNSLLEEQLNLTQIKEKLILENKNLTSNQK